MSHVGKLTRGLKYSLQAVDNVLPEGIAKDPAKMADVDYYKDYIKDKDKHKVDSLLLLCRNLVRKGMGKKGQYREAEAVLNSDALVIKKSSKKEK